MSDAGKIVMTSGAFDLLHVDHVRHLKECREIAGPGGIVIVALNSDRSVMQRKGRKPVIAESQRREMLLETGLADRVAIFGESTPEILIHAFRPAAFVVGSDHSPDRVAGRAFIESYGGRVICRTASRTVSSSEIRERIERDRQ